jgi:hypothetical protein
MGWLAFKASARLLLDEVAAEPPFVAVFNGSKAPFMLRNVYWAAMAPDSGAATRIWVPHAPPAANHMNVPLT